MTDTPDLPRSGGSWTREADGTLRLAEEPTRRRLPHEPEEAAAEEPRRRRRAAAADPVPADALPADPVTES